MSTEENIRASVALKASVDYWSHRSPSEKIPTHADVIETATVFYEWLGQFSNEQPNFNTNPDTEANRALASTPPNGEPSWGCPVCGTAPMKLRTGRNGEFYGCKRYPDCKGTRERDGSTPLRSRAGTSS